MNTEKDQTIKALLRLVDLEARGWEVVDYWDADLHAIGVHRKNSLERIVYVSTFGQEPGRYYCECEISSPADPENHFSILRRDKVDFSELIQICLEFLAQDTAGAIPS